MLPQLVKVSKVDAELRVRVTNRPRVLRSVIGDRRCMEEHGQAIIKGLLQAFFGLQQGGIVCRNIQPSTIRYRKDDWDPMFSDTRRCSKED